MHRPQPRLLSHSFFLVSAFFTIHYHSLPFLLFITILYHSLPLFTILYHSCSSLPFFYHSLPFIAILYHSLQFLLFITILYHSLPFFTIFLPFLLFFTILYHSYHSLPFITIFYHSHLSNSSFIYFSLPYQPSLSILFCSPPFSIYSRSNSFHEKFCLKSSSAKGVSFPENLSQGSGTTFCPPPPPAQIYDTPSDDDNDDDVTDIMIERDLPDDMSPYVFYIVFNDTTFVPFNRNETSHVNTHFHFRFCLRFATNSPY